MRRSLVQTIDRWTTGLEDWSMPIPDLALFHREVPTPPGLCHVPLSIVVIVQGRKRMLVGEAA